MVYCSDSYNSPAEIAKVDEQWEQQMIAATEYVGYVFQQKGAITDFKNKVINHRNTSPNSSHEELSFRELLDPKSQINIANVQKKPKGGMSFLDAWKGAGNGARLQDFSSLAELESFLLEHNLSMYFPYSEVFDSVSFSTITISYFDMVNEDENEGITVSVANGATTQFTSSWDANVNDDYAYSNPTVIIKPYDPINDNIEDPIYPTPTERLLTKNMDHRNISQDDVLLTNIPKMRLTDHYRGIFGGNSKITIYRSSGIFSFNSDGNLIPDAETKRLVNEFEFSRHSVRNKKWLWARITLDNDWDVTEHEHDIVIVSKHWANASGGYTVEGGAKIGLEKLEDGSFIPSFDKVAGSGKWELNFDTWHHVRHNLDYSRRSVLANITSDIGNGLKEHNGNNYTIWRADKVLFHFEHYHTAM